MEKNDLKKNQSTAKWRQGKIIWPCAMLLPFIMAAIVSYPDDHGISYKVRVYITGQEASVLGAMISYSMIFGPSYGLLASIDKPGAQRLLGMGKFLLLSIVVLFPALIFVAAVVGEPFFRFHI